MTEIGNKKPKRKRRTKQDKRNKEFLERENIEGEVLENKIRNKLLIKNEKWKD